MDLEETAESVIEKFKAAGGYSELSDEELFDSVYGFLSELYEKHFSVAQNKIKKESNFGMVVDQARYDAAYAEVEEIVLFYANKLAATDRASI